MDNSTPLDEVFDVNSFETIAESPVSYITTARLLLDSSSPLLAIKSASVLREYSSQPHDIRKELRILRSVSHTNIISVLGNTFEHHTATIHYWMPLITYKLSELLDSRLFSPHAHILSSNVSSASKHFAALARSVAYQLLSAVAHLHTADPPIAHRDIKPANVLITSSGCLKLIDFGISWTNDVEEGDLWPESEGNMCSHVCTGSYRAPETLFSPDSYDALAVDMWCTGVTLSDMFTQLRFVPVLLNEEDGIPDEKSSSNVPQEPYFIPQGTDIRTADGTWERDTFYDARNGTLGLAWSIFQILGSPDEDNWPSFRTLPDATKLVFADAPPVDLHTRLPNLPPSPRHPAASTPCAPDTASGFATFDRTDPCSTGFVPDNAPLDLLMHLIMLEPSRRLRAERALSHSWFTSDPSILLPPIELDSPGSVQIIGFRPSSRVAILPNHRHLHLRTVPPVSITDPFTKFWSGWTLTVEQEEKALKQIDWASLDAALPTARHRAMANLCIQIDYMQAHARPRCGLGSRRTLFLDVLAGAVACPQPLLHSIMATISVYVSDRVRQSNLMGLNR